MVLLAFSPGGEFLAHLSLDGCLKIWNTSSNSLEQEYIPSSHLSATCVTVAWCPFKCPGQLPKRKKKKHDDANQIIEDLNLSIAMGTLSGDVLIYDVIKGDLHSKMSEGHNDTVTGISWLIEEDSLFSCSKDQYIVRWSISKSTVHTKWKAGKTALHSIAVVDANNLLCASNEICWWNIKSQALIKKFTGHATEVSSIVPIHLSNDSSDISYFISSAINDHIISIWQIEDSDYCNPVASCALTEDPEVLDVFQPATMQEPLIISVTTKSGVLQIFQHHLNGRVKKPLSPISTVHMVSTAESDENSQPISILSSKCVQSPNVFKLGYGTFINPIFETVQINLSEKDNYLTRELPSFNNTDLEDVSETKVAERHSDVKILAPGYMTPSRSTKNALRKDKRKNPSSIELPMEEKLSALYLNKASQNQEIQEASSSSSNSMVHLLLQGLRSKDNSLLNTVLQKSDDVLIKNTVKRLPLNSIPLLLTELHRRLTLQEQEDRPSLRWLKCVFGIHLSYLASLQEIDDYVGPVSQLIEASEETFSRMCQLKGFLEILWFQANEDC